ncbi:MAG: hypothetical protein ABEJ74_05420 [Haloferacaceae archaeon]
MTDDSEDGPRDGTDGGPAADDRRPSDDERRDAGAPAGAAGRADAGDADEELDALRAEVEEKYDFDDFGPAQMAEMSPEEWEAAFDPETWIVGEELLDRVQKDLENRIAQGDVFAIVERIVKEGEPRVVAYSDSGYAIVYPDGSVEGEGTVRRDVEPTVALCSMESYEIDEPPANVALPKPGEVPEGSGEFGNLMLQLIGGAQVLAGLGLLVAWLLAGLTIIAAAMGLIFLVVGVFLFTVVANARLSDRFRAEEFRDRLRAAGVEDGERPAFLPPEARPDAPEAEARGRDATDGGEAH